MRVARWALGIGLLGCMAQGCGGHDDRPKGPEPLLVEEGEPLPDAPPESETPIQPEMLPAEKLDEVAAFFDRKRSIVARCWADALEAEAVPAEAEGTITVNMIISPAGQPQKVTVAGAEPRSEMLENCVLERVRSWTITELPRPLEYSYTFGFERL